jgi:hypothetical protein
MEEGTGQRTILMRRRDTRRLRETCEGHILDFGRSLTGVERHAGRLRPYVEIQLLGPVHRLVNSAADFGVQLHSGITWAVR